MEKVKVDRTIFTVSILVIIAVFLIAAVVAGIWVFTT